MVCFHKYYINFRQSENFGRNGGIIFVLNVKQGDVFDCKLEGEVIHSPNFTLTVFSELHLEVDGYYNIDLLELNQDPSSFD